MTITTSRYIGPAAPSLEVGHSPHPLANREIRTQGGPGTADNVRWTHADCNARRQTKPLTTEQVERLNIIRPNGGTS